MTAAPRRISSTIPWIFTMALLASPVLFAGCGGDNPANMAGTIEMPERTVTPAPAAGSFDQGKPNPKAPTP